MKRRTFGISAGAALLAAVGTATQGFGLLDDGCPDPDLENPLSFEANDVKARMESVPGEEVADGVLVTTREEVDGLEEYAVGVPGNERKGLRGDGYKVGPEGKEILRGLDFEEAYAVPIEVAGDDDPLRVLGVDRVSESMIRVHTCHGRNRPDDAAMMTRLLLMPRDGAAPETVEVTTTAAGES